MAQATDPRRAAVIVAHGSPKDPEPQERALTALAARVATRVPGLTVRGATLAADGALEAALDGLDAPLVYPFFMADGWFTRKQLPRRLAAAGQNGARCLAPFGADPALIDLLVRTALDTARAAGLSPANTTLVLAAHGSGRHSSSDVTAHDSARALSARGHFRQVVTGFIEQPPFLADVTRRAGPALCLPFFSLRAGHVLDDIPGALADAGFDGPVLPPIGLHGDVPGLIAATLTKTLQEVPQ
ncbi:CbiX/SirB N-terminal domain-containing protein [Stappia indica]|uniref:CbiX/SirB N-terminal domain-containing protein n=1 Tax=Stappia indica TaxID=538381 RepID=UPI001CD5F045|nr:CbiX/SirB N-terminal domain-containing protein [Stappia indica]MCA1296771.1 hypothetical protein [Stappia indica]